MDLVRKGISIASDPRQTKWITPLLILADAALCLLVVWKIPYTEIDWKAYMQQVAQYIGGELDYVKLYGDTGPLVYPAAHVYIYRLLYAVTDEGKDIKLGQYLFVGVYLASLFLVVQCYRQAGAPPYVFPLLILSKRLHSIFLLRLFNDCFAVFFLFLAIYCYQKRLWTLGSLAYSFGLCIKMSLLLALPGIGVMLWQAIGRNTALQQAVMMGQLQVLLGYPFLSTSPRNYLSRAFEFTRQFLFKWTVNWRFVGEEAFLSRTFSQVLLGAHVVLLSIFVSTRWLSVSLPEAVHHIVRPPPREVQAQIARRVTADFVITTILSAMTIGCLCARSLHYQFYAYIAWSTPFLLWRSGLHPILIYAVWAVQEWAWNVYPSTSASSMTVVGCLAITVLSSLIGTEQETTAASQTTEHAHAE